MENMNLIDANMDRAIFIASVCAERFGDRAGEWRGYSPEEGLNGILVKNDLLRYVRPGHDNGNFAGIFFRGPQLKEIEKVDWGEYNTVEKDVVERYSEKIQKIPGVAYKDTITHTFTKAHTMQEAFKVGAEVAVKAYFEGSGGGVKGGVEIAAKLNTEYSKQWGEAETHTDTVERSIELPADFKGDVTFEAVRSVDKMERTVTAKSNMDYEISFVSAPLIPPENHPFIECNWDSVEQFLNIGMGLEAADKPMYNEFMRNKLADNEVAQIKQTVTFTMNYDNVVSQEIAIK